jgi:hypothetical protein
MLSRRVDRETIEDALGKRNAQGETGLLDSIGCFQSNQSSNLKLNSSHQGNSQITQDQ